MPFDFHYTCPVIDESISHTKNAFLRLLDYYDVEISEDDKLCLVRDLYNEVEEHFEDVREQNSEIRSYSTGKIEDLERDLNSVEEERDQLKAEVYRLEGELDVVRDEYAELRYRMD